MHAGINSEKRKEMEAKKDEAFRLYNSGLTKPQVALAMGMSRSHVGKYLKGF
jgi:predicted transcriptional regulator